MKTKLTAASLLAKETSTLVRLIVTKVGLITCSDLLGQLSVLSGMVMLLCAVVLAAYGVFLFTISLFAPTGTGHFLGIICGAGAVIGFICMVVWILAPISKK